MKAQYKIILVISSIFLMSLVSLSTVVAILFLQNQQNEPLSSFVITKAEPAGYMVREEAVIINGRIEYTNAGSSSCPPIAERVEYDPSSDTYRIFVKQYGNQACTADLHGITQTIEHKDGEAIASDSNVIIVQ